MQTSSNTPARLTATITARGAKSQCPDRDDAIDASITINGAPLCEVTLLAYDGTDPACGLTIWGGDPDCWCSDIEAVTAHEIGHGAIVGAVEAAIEALEA